MTLVRYEPVLIGPPRVGKSTIARLLSNELNIPLCSLDDQCLSVYKKHGFNQELFDKTSIQSGYTAAYEYLKTFEILMIEKILLINSKCIFDFGGGHASYHNKNYQLRFNRIISVFKNTILIMPHNSVEFSHRILKSRFNESEIDFFKNSIDIYNYFLNLSSFFTTIYINNKPFDETINNIKTKLIHP